MKVIFNTRLITLPLLVLLTPFFGAECSFRSFFAKRPLALLAASTTTSFASGLAVPGMAHAESRPQERFCSIRDKVRKCSVARAWFNSYTSRDTKETYRHLKNEEDFIDNRSNVSISWSKKDRVARVGTTNPYDGQWARFSDAHTLPFGLTFEDDQGDLTHVQSEYGELFDCKKVNTSCWCHDKESSDVFIHLRDDESFELRDPDNNVFINYTCMKQCPLIINGEHTRYPGGICDGYSTTVNGELGRKYHLKTQNSVAGFACKDHKKDCWCLAKTSWWPFG